MYVMVFNDGIPVGILFSAVDHKKLSCSIKQGSFLFGVSSKEKIARSS